MPLIPSSRLGTIARMRPRSLSLVAAVALAVAVTSSACGPSIDPAAKADIDRRVAMLQPGSAAMPPPAPGMFAPMPFAVGQWTQYKMTDDKGQPSFLTQKIVGQEGDAVWLESVNESYTGRMITKMLVAFGSRMDPNQVEIRAVKMKDTKRQRERDAAAGDLDDAVDLPGRGVVAADLVAGAAAGGDGCSRRALRRLLQGAHRRAVGPVAQRRRFVGAPGVPLSGTVRSQGVDKPFTMELTAFGTSGAVSEL